MVAARPAPIQRGAEELGGKVLFVLAAPSSALRVAGAALLEISLKFKPLA